MKNTRISFDKYHANHIYELMLEHLQSGCVTCEHIDSRFKKFLGDKETRYIVRLIKKGGYCNKLKK